MCGGIVFTLNCPVLGKAFPFRTLIPIENKRSYVRYAEVYVKYFRAHPVFSYSFHNTLSVRRVIFCIIDSDFEISIHLDVGGCREILCGDVDLACK